ncbi:hypothetical protein Bca52824_072580 [Brassica carinata]|uniref:Telomerase reverse transcriptase n=1 Tax=Brassica carinata TaxID=52824 RepID=A0A8X7U5V7_BRACI|nr:hypothetical protein Bca52824_072580 [Brassica carinata]
MVEKREDATSTPPPLPSFVTITTMAISPIPNRSSPPPWLLRSVFTGVATTTITLVSSLFISERVNLLSFSPTSWWSQREIVEKMIEMIVSGFDCGNVICARYDKSCPVMELLASSSWEFILSRVGHYLMVYLLQHISIFLPFLGKKHQQVWTSSMYHAKG